MFSNRYACGRLGSCRIIKGGGAVFYRSINTLKIIMKKIYRFIRTSWYHLKNEIPKRTVAECKFNTGDRIACSGDGWLSLAIKVGTMSKISHVGVILMREGVPWLCESTTLTTSADAITGEFTKGVQMHKLADRVKEYEGRIYHFPLKERYPRSVEKKIKKWCFEKHYKKTGYDAVQAVVSGLGIVKHLPSISKEDYGLLFCSELCAKVANMGWFAMHWKKITPNPSKENPAEVCDYEDVKQWDCELVHGYKKENTDYFKCEKVV